MATTTNATATNKAVTVTLTPTATNTALTAYTAHCQAIQQAGQVSAKPAYAVQSLLLQGKAVTPEQQAAYDAFVALVKEAQAASMAVKGKVTACSVFNYLDGRVTGHKVVTSLGNSVSLRTFMAGMVTLAVTTTKAVTPANATTNTKKAQKASKKAQATNTAHPAPFDAAPDTMPVMG